MSDGERPPATGAGPDERRPTVNLGGAQTGDVTFGGDVAGGAVHKPTLGPGGIYAAPGSSVTIALGAAPAPALHQLRAPVGDFVGRGAEIERLARALARGAAGVAIAGLRGMGGVGKTELAYAVAARLRRAYPDAQLLVELRGAGGDPLPPERALQTILRAFEREARLPDDLGQLQALYRSALSGRRVLVLADDARDAAQVRPLLPPPGCALLVTSRSRFALPGMAEVDLGALPPEEAVRLALRICPRVGARAGELARLCGWLPLALRLSAGLLAADDPQDVGRFLARLERERLEALADPDDPASSVEASLRLSYEALGEAARAALCQLSVFPSSFDREAAGAVLAGAGEADELLGLLRRRSLLEWDGALGRYSQHDLLRAFAEARLKGAEAARLRHAQHFALVARRAGLELYGQGGAALMEGLALFDRERANLDAAWEWASAGGGAEAADRLIDAFANALAHIGTLRYHARQIRLPRLEAALAAARRRGDRRGEGNTLGNLGSVHQALGDPAAAITCHERSLGLARDIGDRHGEASALGSLGTAYLALGDAEVASSYYERSLGLARAIGDRRTEAGALGGLGSCCLLLGRCAEAIGYHQQWLGIARELGDRRAEGKALGGLAVAYRAQGKAARARPYSELQLAIARELGDWRGEALASWGVGMALVDEGRPAEAIPLLEKLAAYERAVGHAGADAREAAVAYVRRHGRRPGKRRG